MLNQLDTISSIISNLTPLILGLVGGVVGSIGYARILKPVWKRLATNLGREVAVISTEGQPMTQEANLLRRVKLFKVKEYGADARVVDLISGADLLVIGYTENSPVYQAVLRHAHSHKMPIIVFAGANRLTNSDRDDLKSYGFSSLCETELRLVSDVYAVMSTFPEDK